MKIKKGLEQLTYLFDDNDFRNSQTYQLSKMEVLEKIKEAGIIDTDDLSKAFPEIIEYIPEMIIELELRKCIRVDKKREPNLIFVKIPSRKKQLVYSLAY